MPTVGNLVINIAANTVSLEEGLSKSSRLVDDFNRTIGSLGLGTIGAAGAVAGLGKFLGDAMSMAAEAETIQADLNAVLASTGGAAGVTADEINAMASQLSNVTRFEDDAIVKSQAMLLTFTNIGKDVFPAATEAMLNMGEKFGSLDAAALQLGKALNDPVAGVGALRRVGVQLSEEQETQIKKFIEMGDMASAQRVILDELSKEFGGLAVAVGQTTVGQLTILNNKLANAQEAIGTGLLPVVGELVSKFDKLLIPLTGSNEQLATLTTTIAKFEAAPLLSALDNIVFVFDRVNEVTSWFNDLMGSVNERLGLTESQTTQMGQTFRTVMIPITLLTQGPLVALRDILASIADFIDLINKFSPGQVLTDLKNIGKTIGIPEFASGGIVPGRIGQPQLAVVHGGEAIVPPGWPFLTEVKHEQRVYIQTLNLNGVQNVSAFLAQLEALS